MDARVTVLYNSKHTHLRLHLPSATCPSYGTRSLSRIPPASICQGHQASQSEGGHWTDRCLFRVKYQWLGDAVWRNGMLQLQLSPAAPLLCRAAPTIIRSFLVLPVPTSRRLRALVLAQMTDGPPRSTSSCVSAPVEPSPSISSIPVMHSSPFPSPLSIFAPTSLPHPAIPCTPLFSCRTSFLRVRSRSLPQKMLSVSSRVYRLFCLFLHTISLIHRRLAFYHSQVAISEFEGFESSSTSKIRPGICPSILSPLAVCTSMCMPHGIQIW
jgi:hypothetical protein